MTFSEFLTTYNIALNEQQLAAVQAVEGPVLLLAVPGSGKTTVLVTRLGYMVCCRAIAPEQILTLTYTVAAAHDMAARFERYFGPELRDRLEFRTINGVCAKIINHYGRLIGKTAFQLVTEEKPIAGMLSSIYQKVENTYPTESDIKSARTLITYIKNMMLSPEEIQKLEEEAGFQISEIYRCYCSEMRRQGLMDYDDQMIYALNILRMSSEILQYFRNQYRYICVDEAQDTSKIQHMIIALLAGGNENLFMVGDEDQSIYGFRAAYPEALLSFEKNHPGAKVLLMEENFRSNAKIVEAADQFIQKNIQRHEKHMRAHREGSSDIREIQLKSRKAQYMYLEKVAADCKSQTAVLYRDNESVLPLVDRLERKGIPYRMRNADLTFFTHRVVLDIQNIIRFAMNPWDTELFMQIYYKVNLYINKQNAIRFCEISEKRKIPVLEAAVRYGHLPGYTAGSIKAIQTHMENMLEESAEKAINRIVRFMGYDNYLERAGMSDAKIFILNAVASLEQSPESLVNRMEQLQQIIREKQNDPRCPFILSTIHASKGLEYDTVYLLDVADGIFPENVPMNYERFQSKIQKNRFDKKDPKDRKTGFGKSAFDVLIPDLDKSGRKELETYEEERRLFYVGVTRAKNNLNLFKLPMASVFRRDLLQMRPNISEETASSKGISASGHDPVSIRYPASFRSSAAGNPLRSPNGADRTGQPRRKKHFAQSEYDAFCDSLGEGIGVIHKKFGHGIVSEMSEEYVTVQFEDTSRKMMLRILFENEILQAEQS